MNIDYNSITSSVTTSSSTPLQGGRGERLCLARDFQRGETVGAGSQGCVFTARHRTSGQIVAVKEVFLDRQRAAPAERLARELRLCESLEHTSIVRYLGHEFVIGSHGGPERVYLYLEYCNGGSVAAHMRNYGPLDAPLIKKYTAQLLEGLIYLHSRSPPVVHRDLKCANLLLDRDANMKIADFGCSKLLISGEKQPVLAAAEQSVAGSVFWMAPEVFRGRIAQTCAVDIWSLGCCLVEMATANPPWMERNFDNILQAGYVIADTDAMPRMPEDAGFDRFTVNIKKVDGNNVGCMVGEVARCLQIKSLQHEGLLAEWNRKNSKLEVKMYDEVVQVNGVVGTASELIAELQSADGLEMIIQRRNQVASFARACLRRDPLERPTALELRRHPLLTDT